MGRAKGDRDAHRSLSKRSLVIAEAVSQVAREVGGFFSAQVALSRGISNTRARNLGQLEVYLGASSNRPEPGTHGRGKPPAVGFPHDILRSAISRSVDRRGRPSCGRKLIVGKRPERAARKSVWQPPLPNVAGELTALKSGLAMAKAGKSDLLIDSRRSKAGIVSEPADL